MKPDSWKLTTVALAVLLSGCASSTLAPIPSGSDRVAINASPIEVAAVDTSPPSIAPLESAQPAQVEATTAPVASSTVAAATQPAVMAQGSQPGQSQSAESNAAQAAISPASGMPVFAVGVGNSLRDSLADYLQSQGWRLAWRAESTTPGRVRDFRIEEGMSYTPASISDLLQFTLAGRGLTAVVSKSSNTVLIENDRNALPRGQQ